MMSLCRAVAAQRYTKVLGVLFNLEGAAVVEVDRAL